MRGRGQHSECLTEAGFTGVGAVDSPLSQDLYLQLPQVP